jgi:hypothetical protein
MDWCATRIPKLDAYEVTQNVIYIKETQSYSCHRPWSPIGLWDAEAPTFSLDNRLTDGSKVVSLTRRSSFTPWRFLVLISVTDWVDPSVIVRLERLGKLKESTLSGREPPTFWLVAYCVNQLRCRMPLCLSYGNVYVGEDCMNKIRITRPK